MKINRIYGILMLGAVLPQNNPGYRYSNEVPTDNQSSYLTNLVPVDVASRAIVTDFLIKLLSCSPYWPEVVRSFDPDNTYDVSVVDSTASLSDNPLSLLLAWADNISPHTDKYPYTDTDPDIDKALAKLLTVITDAN